MKFKPLEIPGTFELYSSVFEDSRGTFEKIYSEDFYTESNLSFEIKQVNVSRNLQKATIRGLHFQSAPLLEKKIVTCLSGVIFDVMVDLRPLSKTFGKWQSVILNSASNGVLVPVGVAHGFQTLSDNCVVQYLHSENYFQSLSGGIKFNDPEVGINWPLEVSMISNRDLSLPQLSDLRLRP